MIIYPTEIIDGLEDKLKCNAVAFNCSLVTIEKPTEAIDIKSIASVGEGRNFDLYFLKSILASVGINKNDDVFLPEEIWAARNTPVHKQFNYMHDEKDIIGTIISSFLLDTAGQVLSAEDQILNIKDIGTEAVIWTQWADKELTNRLTRIISEIEEGKLFVSMECLFNKFDYLHIKGENQTFIPRTEKTSALTKHLRSFGGSGEVDGGRLYRVLRDFTFSGKGLVDDPANPRSIIDESLGQTENKEFEIIYNTPEITSTKAERNNIMEEEMKKEIAELKEQLAKANESIASLKTSAEFDALKSQNEALQTLASEAKQKMDEMEKEYCAKIKEKDDAFAAKIQEAEAKLAELNVEKQVANRKALLAAANVDSTKCDEIITTWNACSDEQFAKIVALYSNAPVVTETVTEVEDVIETSKANNEQINPNGAKEIEDRIGILSKSMASKLFPTKSKKTE